LRLRVKLAAFRQDFETSAINARACANLAILLLQKCECQQRQQVNDFYWKSRKVVIVGAGGVGSTFVCGNYRCLVARYGRHLSMCRAFFKLVCAFDYPALPAQMKLDAASGHFSSRTAA
jgi:accessory colonization factor AcfC